MAKHRIAKVLYLDGQLFEVGDDVTHFYENCVIGNEFYSCFETYGKLVSFDETSLTLENPDTKELETFKYEDIVMSY